MAGREDSGAEAKGIEGNKILLGSRRAQVSAETCQIAFKPAI
jgi:hypothetical protein